MAVEALSSQELREAVQRGLAEDVGSGDVTTLATVPEQVLAKAAVRSREPLVVAGLTLAEVAFREVSSQVDLVRRAEEGEHVAEGKTLLEVSGPARALLTAERVALNFLQHLSGIAT